MMGRVRYWLNLHWDMQNAGEHDRPQHRTTRAYDEFWQQADQQDRLDQMISLVHPSWKVSDLSSDGSDPRTWGQNHQRGSRALE